MKNNFVTYCIIAVFFAILSSFSYGKNGMLANECRDNFSPSCLALLEQAKKQNNEHNIAIYKAKLLDIMDNACKRDYQTCLILSRIYESSENSALQSIRRDIKEQKIPTQIQLPNYIKDSISKETKKFFEDTDFIVNLMRENPNPSKSLQYQEKAINILEHTCYDSQVVACLYLRYFYEYGAGVAQNRPKAERLLNLGLDFATKECVLGNMESCRLLNSYKEYREEISNDLAYLSRKCDENDVMSCYKVSLYYTQDFYMGNTTNNNIEDDKSDFVKAAIFLKKACKNDISSCRDTIFNIKYAKECLIDNDIKACANTHSVKPEFFALACNGGNMNSCYELRYLPTFNDTKRYVKLLQRTCRGGIIQACVDLSEMYDVGNRVSKNKERSLNFIQRACAWSMKKKLGGNYCYFAGLGYERGEYVKQDIEKAIDAYRYACMIDEKNYFACERLGVLYENYKQNMNDALKWYEKACKLSMDSVISCMQVAKYYINGEYLDIDEVKAVKIYESLLQNKEAPEDEVYYNLANIYSTKEFQNKKAHITKENSRINYAKALEYYRQACNLGLQIACGKKLNIPDLAKECKEENENSCYQLATLAELIQKDSSYENMLVTENKKSLKEEISNNSLISKDSNKVASLSLYKQACKGNVVEACIRFYNETNGVFDNDLVLQESMCRNFSSLPIGILSRTTINNEKDSNSLKMEAKRDNSLSKVDFNVKSICLNFAKEAIKMGEYQKAINVLKQYQTKDDKTALDLLVKAYFYAKEYNNVIDVYKLIYAYDIPNDYFYLAQMYVNGFGIKQSYEMAMNIYKISHSARSYLGLAQMYDNGFGVQKSIFDAKEYYKLACPLDTNDETKVENEACANLGSIIYNEGDFRNAQKYYLKACEMGYSGDIISCDKN